jgi:hypothetical protein
MYTQAKAELGPYLQKCEFTIKKFQEQVQGMQESFSVQQQYSRLAV